MRLIERLGSLLTPPNFSVFSASSNLVFLSLPFKGAMDSEAFAAYIEQVLIPELGPGTVVILDNLATHKTAAAGKAMREAGC